MHTALPMTRHAQQRTQQRAIPQLAVDLLLQFGRSEPAGDGATKYFFDKKSHRRVFAYAGSMSNVLEPHLDIYAVVSPDQRLITVAHRIERIRRN